MQCVEEIRRLEVDQAKAMRGIIQRNITKIHELCSSTGLPAPDLAAIVSSAETPGQVAEALHRVNVALSQLQEVVKAREPVMKVRR